MVQKKNLRINFSTTNGSNWSIFTPNGKVFIPIKTLRFPVCGKRDRKLHQLVALNTKRSKRLVECSHHSKRDQGRQKFDLYFS